VKYLSEYIKTEREKKGFSCEELANLVGFSVDSFMQDQQSFDDLAVKNTKIFIEVCKVLNLDRKIIYYLFQMEKNDKPISKELLN